MIIALPLTTLCLSYYEQYVINRSDEADNEKKVDCNTIDSIANKP